MTAASQLSNPSVAPATEVAKQLLANVKKHDVGQIRVREIRTFVHAPIPDPERRAQMHSQSVSVIEAIVPALLNTLGSNFVFESDALMGFRDDVARIIEKCMLGNRAPYNKVLSEAEAITHQRVSPFLPFRMQLILSLREVHNKGVTLSANFHLLRHVIFKGQSVYKSAHEENVVIKAKILTAKASG